MHKKERQDQNIKFCDWKLFTFDLFYFDLYFFCVPSFTQKAALRTIIFQNDKNRDKNLICLTKDFLQLFIIHHSP